MSRVIIIGGGAAGMMAAGFAAQYGHQVTVLEKSKTTCLKLGITGKGRCNVTNNCDTRTLIENIPQNGKFLYGAFKRFSPQDTMDFFEKQGVKTPEQRVGAHLPEVFKLAHFLGFQRQMLPIICQKRGPGGTVHTFAPDGGQKSVSAFHRRRSLLLLVYETIITVLSLFSTKSLEMYWGEMDTTTKKGLPFLAVCCMIIL